MKKIQMVDLQGQYEPLKAQIQQSFDEVLSSAAFINGPQVQALQKELDEVITADFTFAATVEVIALLGLTPVLVDVKPNTFNIDIEAIKRAITPKTKAIVPVHLYGRPANMEVIMQIAKEHNLFVIEDNAQGIGADYTWSDGHKQKLGTIGQVGATSFFPSKNLGCYGDGGAIFTNDDALAHTLRGIVNHGMYVRYHHDVVGVNSRLDSLQACVLRAKLPHLDTYNTAHVFHQYTIRITNGKRDALAEHLSTHGVPFGIYYPIPLHQQKAYTDPRYKEADFPVTNLLVQEVLSLPMHTELDEEQINFITKLIIDFV